MSKVIDLTGQKFGNLTVIERTGSNKEGKALWLCKCSCGNTIITTGKLLRKGETKSCGCIKTKPNRYKFKDNICIATTFSGVQHIFDIEDYDKVKNITWRLTDFGYIYGVYKNKKQVFIHQLITDFKYSTIDHINGNKLDNRKCNLRPATPSQNAMNRHNTPKSGYIGVYQRKDNNKWAAKICINYKPIYLGSFDNIEDAIIARLKAEKKYCGEFAPQRHLFEKYNIT